jgi:hypothetical protein
MAAPNPISKPPNTPDTPPRRAARCAVLLGLTLTLLAPLTVSAGGVREDHPNLVGGEVLGRGLVVSLNYERFLTNHFGLGGGAMVYGDVGIMPLYFSFLPGDTHSLYLSAGGALLGGTGVVRDFERTFILQESIGYHFQYTNGFFIRSLVTLNHATNGSGVWGFWPGLTIGGSF